MRSGSPAPAPWAGPQIETGRRDFHTGRALKLTALPWKHIWIKLLSPGVRAGVRPNSKTSRYRLQLTAEAHALAASLLHTLSCSPFSAIKATHAAPRSSPRDSFRGSDPPRQCQPPHRKSAYRVGAAARPGAGARAAALLRGGGQQSRPSPRARPPPSRPARGGAVPGARFSSRSSARWKPSGRRSVADALFL